MANFAEIVEALPSVQYSWHLDELVGATNCVDETGQLDGVYHDNVLEYSPSDIIGLDSTVKFTAIDNSWIGPLGAAPYGVTSTTSSWVAILNKQGQTTATTVLSSTRNGNNNFFQVQIRTDGTIMLYIRGDTNPSDLAYTTVGHYVAPLNEDIMVIITRDNTTGWHVYVNNPNGDAIDVPLTLLIDNGGYDQSDWIHTNCPGNDRFQIGILRRNNFSGPHDGTFTYFGGVDDTITQLTANALNTAFYDRPVVIPDVANIWAGDGVSPNQATNMATGTESSTVVDDNLIGTIGTPIGNFNWWSVEPVTPPVEIPLANIRYSMNTWPPVDSEGLGYQATTVNQGSTPAPTIQTLGGVDGSYLDWSGCIPDTPFNGYVWKTDPQTNFASTDNLTFSLWYKIPSGYSGGNSILYQDKSLGDRKHRGFVIIGGVPRWRTRNSDDTEYFLETAAVYDKWVHIVYQQVGDTVDCWQDGVKVGTITILGTATGISWRSYIHGGNSYRTYSSLLMESQFNGFQDDVRIWDNVQLTDEQIVALYDLHKNNA